MGKKERLALLTRRLDRKSSEKTNTPRGLLRTKEKKGGGECTGLVDERRKEKIVTCGHPNLSGGLLTKRLRRH